MISEKIKNTIQNSEMQSLLNIDDENNIISGNFFRIRNIEDNKGDAEFYLFDYAFTGKAFMNDIDSCYIELDDNTNININLRDMLSVSAMTTDLKILNFFHIKTVNVKPKTSIY